MRQKILTYRVKLNRMHNSPLIVQAGVKPCCWQVNVNWQCLFCNYLKLLLASSMVISVFFPTSSFLEDDCRKTLSQAFYPSYPSQANYVIGYQRLVSRLPLNSRPCAPWAGSCLTLQQHPSERLQPWETGDTDFQSLSLPEYLPSQTYRAKRNPREFSYPCVSFYRRKPKPKEITTAT